MDLSESSLNDLRNGIKSVVSPLLGESDELFLDEFIKRDDVCKLIDQFVKDITKAWKCEYLESKPCFTVANAKSGEPYRAKIEGRDKAGRSVVVADVKIPDGLGLSFDPETGELHGVPSIAGDHRMALQWHYGNKHLRSDNLLLIVNPNPRDLWKTIEPDCNDPYFKPNEDSCCIQQPAFTIAAASKRGRSHAHTGTFRDDDFFVHHDADSGWSVLIVADGAGSAKNSRKGSELAVKTAGQYLQTQLDSTDGNIEAAIKGWEADPDAGTRPLRDALYHLFGRAAHKTIQTIDQEAKSKGFLYKDYSTTLLAAVCKKEPSSIFIATFWLGDGAVAAYQGHGRVRLLGTPDSGEFAGQTRFLDNQVIHDNNDLWKRIAFARFDNLKALILMTDGISDPRFETDNGLTDGARWDALWAEMAPALADPDPDKRLVEWLDFFTPGHHDDRTIALLWIKELMGSGRDECPDEADLRRSIEGADAEQGSS